MKNKIDLVNDAFSMLLRTGVTVKATNADIELALGRLEDVMHELESRNMATGYNFENPPQPDSPSGLEDYMNLAVSRLLAVNVWPDFSPEEVNPMLYMQATQSQSNLSARLAQQSMLKYAKRMPIGSGNQPYQQYQKFYGDYSADCGTGCASPSVAPVPPPFDSDAIVVDNLKLLASESTSDATGKAFFVTSFYAGWSTPSGGGWFAWSAATSKAAHNGVTIYAPEALDAWSGAQSDIATLLNWTGSGSGCWLRNDLQGFVTPEMAGAVGDGVSIDTESFQAAINAASGVMSVHMGLANYLIDDKDGNFSGLVVPTSTKIVGLGTSKSSVTVKPGEDCHALSLLSSISDVYLSNFSIYGNGDTQAGGHGIRVAGIDGLNIRNVNIIDAYFYGIGIQAGTNKNIFIDTLIIRNSGGDGIDIKNYNDSNEQIYISNVVIDSHGRLTDSEVQAGIDCRGIVFLSNITVVGLKNNRHAVRFREGDPTNKVTYPAGQGGRYSKLNGLTVRYDGLVHTSSVGVYIADPNIIVSNVTCIGAWRGIIVDILASNTTLSNLVFKDCQNRDISIGKGRLTVSNIYAEGCLLDSIGINNSVSDVYLSNVIVSAARYGATVGTSCTRIKFNSGYITGTTAAVNNSSGSNTQFYLVDGPFNTIANNTSETIGTTAQRPTIGIRTGQRYIDTTLLKDIWYDGTNWRDSNGAIV